MDQYALLEFPRTFLSHSPTAVYHPFVLREAGLAPQKGPPEHGLSWESKISPNREVCGVTAGPSRAGDRTLSPAGSRMPVETPSQRDPAAAPEERGVVILAGSVSLKFEE